MQAGVVGIPTAPASFYTTSCPVDVIFRGERIGEMRQSGVSPSSPPLPAVRRLFEATFHVQSDPLLYFI